MNTHKNARLTYLRRLEMVQDITERGLSRLRSCRQARRQRRHRSQVAGPLPGRRRGRPAGQVLSPDKSPRAIEPQCGPDHRRAAPQAVPASPTSPRTWACPRPRSAACCAAPGCPVERSAPDEPVQRYERDAPWRAAAHRHQEARALRQGRPSHHRRPHASALATSAGTTSSWPWTTTAGSPSRRSIRTKPSTAPRRSCAPPWPLRAAGRARPARAHRQRHVVPTRRCSPRPASSWASPRSSPEPIARRPTARPSASSSRPCANGPTAAPTRTQTSAGSALPAWTHSSAVRILFVSSLPRLPNGMPDGVTLLRLFAA